MGFEVTFVDGPIRAPAVPVRLREVGAMVEFRGIVRESEGASALSALCYETYEAMARREFARIFTELSAKHPVNDVVVIHRIGRVAVGEPSLYVRVLAKHRGEALSFCGALIDRMKEDVPIWKMPEPAGS
jgi:molybdopterin synthase catalytic subunit